MMRSYWLVLLCTLVVGPAAAAPAESPAWPALEQGAIVLFRHATAPGVGDPTGFTLASCATQRNLDDRGRREARAIGDAFRARGIKVGAVRSSQWCRTHETAELAFPGQVEDDPVFNSFFERSADETARTAAALAELARWTGPGTLVVVTHQVNITALTGVNPASAEGTVVRIDNGRLRVIGRITSAP